MGASMTFCRAVKCGNSANCWKTIPISRTVRPQGFARVRNDVALVRHALTDKLAVKPDLTLIGNHEPVDAPQERGLARPAWTDHRENLAGADIEIDPVEDDVRPE